MKEKSINQQILIWMLLVSIVPLCLLSIFYLYSYDKNFKKHKIELLTLIADKKRDSIDSYIEERIKDAVLIRHSPATIEGLKLLVPEFEQYRHNISKYPSIMKNYGNKFQHFLEHGFYDIFLISTSKTIILTLKQEDDLFTNLATGVYAETELATQVNKALLLEEPSLSKFSYYPPSKKRAAFIAVPVIENKTLLGVIALQLDIDRLQDVIYDSTGLGLTGKSKITTAYDLQPLLFSGKVTDKSSLTRVMQKALNGMKGHSLYTDQFGHKVLGIMQYLPFLDAGFVVEIDLKEIFEELEIFWTLSITAVLIACSVIIYAAHTLSNTISRPIIKLTRLSAHISQGDKKLKELTDIPRGIKEISQLHLTFNKMIKQIEYEKSLLEQRVEQRTLEITRNAQHLSLYREQSPVATIEWDAKGCIVDWNHEAEKIFGYSLSEVKGRHFNALIIPDTEKKQVDIVWQRLISGTGGKTSVNKNLTKAGKIIVCEWYNTVIKDKSGLIIGAASLVFDITERKLIEERLQFAARIYTETHEAIMLTDTNAIIIDVNPSFSRITGYTREEAIGKKANFLSSGKQGKAFYARLWNALKENGTWRGELWNRSKSGALFAELLTISALVDDNNKVINYVGLFSDITVAKKQQQSIEYLAHYDALTGLPNRVLFADRFLQAIAHSDREQSMLAVCFIDLDKFKPVNDTYGHNIGDKILIEVAHRISINIRKEDTASRLGGDEFTLLLGDLASVEQCQQAMLRIHQAIAQPYVFDNQFITIEASSGITIYPLDKGDPDTLVRHADSAMYQAKLSGRNRYHLFDPSEEQKIIEHHKLRQEIKSAIDRQEFCLYYQPKLNMQTGEIYGVEALVRWIHPDRGLIPPLDFLPYIDGSELEIRFGNWVLSEAMRQLEQWIIEDPRFSLQVSVNISPQHLQWEGFFAQVESILAQHPNIRSNLLQLEILESSVLDDVHTIGKIIDRLKLYLGISIALDDFGTGYSSLTHLRRISADTIKIDQSFVRDMLVDRNDHMLVEGIIMLSKNFKRKVIAEGVETREHELKLAELGCFHAQGYGIAKPMPASKLISWLQQRGKQT